MDKIKDIIKKDIKPVLKQEEITEKKLIEYMNTFGLAQNLSSEHKLQFISIAKEFQLNPFKREIYAVPYKKKEFDSGEWIEKNVLSITIGYEVFLKRAERSNKLDGWSCKIREGTTLNEMKAIITIYRKDWTHPFEHEIYYSEVVKTYTDKTKGKVPTKFWSEQPKFMLKKVCTAQGMRLCFPDELGGLPYIAEEMPEHMTEQTAIKTEIKEIIEHDFFDKVIFPALENKELEKETLTDIYKQVGLVNPATGYGSAKTNWDGLDPAEQDKVQTLIDEVLK